MDSEVLLFFEYVIVFGLLRLVISLFAFSINLKLIQVLQFSAFGSPLVGFYIPWFTYPSLYSKIKKEYCRFLWVI